MMSLSTSHSLTADLMVYGATPAGIACAIRAARNGSNVLLVHPTRHVGGFMTSGAGGWESPYDGHRCPLLTEMYDRITDHYAQTYGLGSPQHQASMPDPSSCKHIDRRKVEPRVIEQLFMQMLGEEVRLSLLVEHELADVAVDNNRITTITVQPAKAVRPVAISATVFVDGTYEGDLAAMTGVPYRIGREGRDEYGEPHAGKVFTIRTKPTDEVAAWPCDAALGKLNMRTFGNCGEKVDPNHSTGQADPCVMAYNYRLILTDDPDNRVTVTKPSGYDADQVKHLSWSSIVPNVPNRKIAWNAGRLIGPQHGYPDGDKASRHAIEQTYLNAILSLLWYIQNDPSAPQEARDRLGQMGLAKDEFSDNGYVPYEIYVREGRRILGRYMLTEHDCVREGASGRTPCHADSVAITDWPMDSVACNDQRHEGTSQDGVYFLSESSRPAQVPYRCMLPRDCDNLLVPVAVSATHVAYGAIRLEPVWIQLGEAAGFASAMCKGLTTPVNLDANQLRRAMIQAGCVVSFFNDVDQHGQDGPIVQLLGTCGFFTTYNADLDAVLDVATAEDWTNRWRQLSRHAEPLMADQSRRQAVRCIALDLLHDMPQQPVA